MTDSETDAIQHLTGIDIDAAARIAGDIEEPDTAGPQTGPTAMEALYDVRQMLTGVPPHRPDRFAHPVPLLYLPNPCMIPRPTPHVFYRSRCQRWLLWLSLLALVAIAAWIIIGVGR